MLGWIFSLQLIVALIGRSLGPLGILIGSDLSLTKTQIGMMPSALFIGQAIAAIPIGFLVDRFGSRILLVVLSFLTGISFLIMTLAQSFWIVLILTILGGIGYGGMHPATNKGIVFWFPMKQRGVSMGIKQMSITIGSALSGALLLPMANHFGWRNSLFVSCIILIILGMLTYYFFKDPIAKDLKTKSHFWNFICHSLKEIIRNKPLLWISICAMGLIGAQVSFNTYIILYLYENIELSLLLSGWLLVVSELAGSIGRVAWGGISDKWLNGNRLIVLIIISFISLLMNSILAILPKGVSFLTLIPIITILGFALSGFNGIWMNIASELVPVNFAGIASGFSITVGCLGVILIPPLFGITVDYSGSYLIGWILLDLILAFVMVLLFVFYGKYRNVNI
jgi:MFS transporter, ACS family, hexuronate transporter